MLDTETGVEIGAMPQPWAQDSHEGNLGDADDGIQHYTSDGSYQLSDLGDGKYLVTVVIPSTYLENAVYPVLIDPVYHFIHNTDLQIKTVSKSSINNRSGMAWVGYETFLNSDDMYLKKLWYDEESSNYHVKGYVADGIDELNIIIFFTDHHTGYSNLTHPNFDYENHLWILMRDSRNDEWRIVANGFR